MPSWTQFSVAIGILLSLNAPRLPAEEPASVQLTEKTAVRFATAEKGRELLAARDRYVLAQSPFDRQVRIRTDRDVSVDEYLAFVGKQALDFDNAEVDRLRTALEAIAKRLTSLNLPWPETVWILKTTGDEESRAAHCRGPAVVLPRRMLARDGDAMQGLLTHELFHVLSSHNAELRDKLYRVIGFERIADLSLPAEVAARKITNPDAPLMEHAIELEIDAKKRWFVPILLSSHDRYDTKRGGGIFDYMKFQLLEVESTGAKNGLPVFAAVMRDGKPVLLDPKDTPSYHQRIGKNTNYIIHPEEIMADNFMQLVAGRKDAPTPRILEEAAAILAK